MGVDERTCTGRLLVNARVLQGLEDGRWLWRGRERRRKKEKREYAARRVFKRGPVCVGRTAPPFAIPTQLGRSLNTLLRVTFFLLFCHPFSFLSRETTRQVRVPCPSFSSCSRAFLPSSSPDSVPSLIHHLPSETSCSLSACTSFLSDHRRCCASVFLSPRIRYLPS